MNETDELRRRVVDLELRFMKLEKFTHELSDVVASQARTIEMLSVEAKKLRDRLQDEGTSAPHEPPPHY